jgi:hypothetical protein
MFTTQVQHNYAITNDQNLTYIYNIFWKFPINLYIDMEFCFLNKEHICAFANPDLITTNCCNIYISYDEVSHVKIQKQDMYIQQIV